LGKKGTNKKRPTNGLGARGWADESEKGKMNSNKKHGKLEGKKREI